MPLLGLPRYPHIVVPVCYHSCPVAQALPKLLSHRHRTPTSQPLTHPSIRTGLTTLILSLLPLTLPLDLFTALFRGLAQDDGAVIKLVLETCWEKVWCDVKVAKSLKVKVFGGLGVYVSLVANFICLIWRLT